MARELRITLAILAVALIVCAPLIFAAPGPANTNYLAAVFHIVPPTPVPTATPVPTPVPPDISTLVIQLSEMKSGYVRDTWTERTNADAAKGYHDPKAAAAAFAAQGRETSWIAQYSSTDYAFSDALAVSSQVFRYLTSSGASDGMGYTVAESMRDHADFRSFNVSVPCCPTIRLRRTFTQDGYRYDHFLIIVQVGRYVTETQAIGLSGSLTVSRATAYAQLAVNHLTPVPQAMHADDVPAAASAPQSDTLQAALSPR